LIVPPKEIHVEEISRQKQDNGDTIIKLKYTIAGSNPKSSIDLSGIENLHERWLIKHMSKKVDNMDGHLQW
jgi:hypothetical protein